MHAEEQGFLVIVPSGLSIKGHRFIVDAYLAWLEPMGCEIYHVVLFIYLLLVGTARRLSPHICKHDRLTY
jgi:hypothetical protein